MRQWNNPNPSLYPTIYYTKKLILSLAATRSIILYCDMHGHSKLKNMVLYSCNLSQCDKVCIPYALKNTNHYQDDDDEIKQTVKASAKGYKPDKVCLMASKEYTNLIFRYLLSKRSCNYFSLNQSTSTVTKYKIGSARVNLYQHLALSTIYTLETSFYVVTLVYIKNIIIILMIIINLLMNLHKVFMIYIKYYNVTKTYDIKVYDQISIKKKKKN